MYKRQQQQGRAVLRFDTTTWNFGNIQEVGGKVSHTFHFTNMHTSPVVIEEVISTCGCAISVYSKQPVKPGHTGTITVTFDPKGRTNFFSKSIRVVSNSGQSVNTPVSYTHLDVYKRQLFTIPIAGIPEYVWFGNWRVV